MRKLLNIPCLLQLVDLSIVNLCLFQVPDDSPLSTPQIEYDCFQWYF